MKSFVRKESDQRLDCLVGFTGAGCRLSIIHLLNAMVIGGPAPLFFEDEKIMKGDGV